ncbi:hypothetical protein ACRALDRAFT_213318 [Sodiomyces alcalophilus JCM 7366]|uniref:uncharacterized protein n=1 Tax=Sodiomyces alcalophilus JCM 7366 TaxID=591952 RepID=UPI0039B43663
MLISINRLLFACSLFGCTQLTGNCNTKHKSPASSREITSTIMLAYYQEARRLARLPTIRMMNPPHAHSVAAFQANPEIMRKMKNPSHPPSPSFAAGRQIQTCRQSWIMNVTASLFAVPPHLLAFGVWLARSSNSCGLEVNRTPKLAEWPPDRREPRVIASYVGGPSRKHEGIFVSPRISSVVKLVFEAVTGKNIGLTVRETYISARARM